MGTRARLLTPEALILRALERGPLRAKELEEKVNLPKSTLYRSLDELQLAGLIRRHEQGTAVYYEITSEGRKALARARAELAAAPASTA